MIGTIDLIIIIFEILFGLGIISFWIIFYITEFKNPKMSEIIFKHEKSFPLPDLGWITPCLFIAAIGILLEQDFGYFFTALAGSGMMFLGLIDLAFNIQNDIFKKKNSDSYMAGVIVSLMLIFSPIFIAYAWINLSL